MEFTFDVNENLIRLIYFGKTEINPIKFESLIGLHKNYFHNMFELYE